MIKNKFCCRNRFCIVFKFRLNSSNISVTVKLLDDIICDHNLFGQKINLNFLSFLLKKILRKIFLKLFKMLTIIK